jgi:hypothetical protein
VLERREATREEGLRTPSKQKEERTSEGRERERERHTHRGLGRAGRGDARVRTGPPTRNGPGASCPPSFSSACPSDTGE